VNGEGPILDEAMENLKEAARLVRATQNRLWSAGKIDHPNYRNLTHRVSSALAMTEAAFVEARRRSERA
jgi:ABC-type enterobactin transport system permease subunit